jgi:hypothetical protein
VEVGRLLAIGLPWQAIMDMAPAETEAIVEGYETERARQASEAARAAVAGMENA